MIDQARPLDAPRWAGYLLCDAYDNVDWAKERFVEKFGHKPRFVWNDGKYLFLGPVSKGEDDE